MKNIYNASKVMDVCDTSVKPDTYTGLAHHPEVYLENVRSFFINVLISQKSRRANFKRSRQLVRARAIERDVFSTALAKAVRCRFCLRRACSLFWRTFP